MRPRPHIGFVTVTCLFDSQIIHRDSLGTDQLIRAGAVNWMIAGRGITHFERTGGEERRRPPRASPADLGRVAAQLPRRQP